MTKQEIEQILEDRMPHFNCECYPECKCTSDENYFVICSERQGAAAAIAARVAELLEGKEKEIKRLEEEQKAMGEKLLEWMASKDVFVTDKNGEVIPDAVLDCVPGSFKAFMMTTNPTQ